MFKNEQQFEYFDWSKNGYPELIKMQETCKIIKTDVNYNDPDNLIFLCKNIQCGRYHKIYENDLLRYSIYYMEAKHVKKLFQLMTIEEIENIKMYEKSTQNILDYVLTSLSSFSSVKYLPTLSNTWNDSFTNPYMNYKETEKLKCKKYLELLEVLCEYLPHFINEKHFKTLNYSANVRCIEVLNKYYQKENANFCYICLGTYQNELIDSICNCKNCKIHVSCLISVVKKLGDKCKTCNGNFNHRIDQRCRVFFPFSNIYFEPLLSNLKILPSDDFGSSLHYACCYLVADRVEQLLEEISDDEFLSFKNRFKHIPTEAKYYITFKLDKEGYLMMKEYPSSNMSINHYPDEHIKINKLFREREISIRANQFVSSNSSSLNS